MAGRTIPVLNVTDLAKSQTFYEAVGFTTEETWEDDEGTIRFVQMSLDGAELELVAIASNDDPEFRDWVAGPLGAGVMVNFTVEDVDAVFENAQEAGAVVEMEPTDAEFGRYAHVNDPDGYVIGFVEE